MEHQDRWLDLIERFAARGARVSIGNMTRDMITHLLDVAEEQAVQIDALKADVARLQREGEKQCPSGS